MHLDHLYQILAETTVQLRKGEPVVEEQGGDIHITHVYAMPHESEATEDLVKVDCYFIVVGVKKAKAEEHRAELKAILDTYPDPERLKGGPSYIEVGGVIGDQGAAFQLFALGEVLGFWKVITPTTLGFKPGPAADMIAGQGLILISGYEPVNYPGRDDVFHP